MKTLNNTVIANRKKGDWKIIKNYFEDRGVEEYQIEGWSGRNRPSEVCFNDFYYGVINGEFSVYSLSDAQQANATILEVSDIDKEFKVGDVVVGWQNTINEDNLHKVPWEIERISDSRFIYPKNRPTWCCNLNHIRHATPEEIKQYKGISDTVTLPKSFVLEMHDYLPPVMKKRIEEVVPELFPRNELIVGKWYKGRNYIFCFNGRFGNFTQYGIDGKGNWNEEIGVHKDIDYVPATEQEVFEALNQQRIKLGLVKGATIKTHQGTFKLETDEIVYSNKHGNEGIYIKQDFGLWICMNGKWAELISQPIPKELQSLIDKHGKEEIIKMLK